MVADQSKGYSASHSKVIWYQFQLACNPHGDQHYRKWIDGYYVGVTV